MTPLIAEAVWYFRVGPGSPWGTCDTEPTILRACIGATGKKVSVWLPRGKRIVFTLGKQSMLKHGKPQTLTHRYGRGRHWWQLDAEIRCLVRPLNPGEVWPDKPVPESFKLGSGE